jgi:hypothetical protein
MVLFPSSQALKHGPFYCFDESRIQATGSGRAASQQVQRCGLLRSELELWLIILPLVKRISVATTFGHFAAFGARMDRTDRNAVSGKSIQIITPRGFSIL